MRLSNVMFILTRYFSSPKYQAEFMSGSIFCSSMSKFTEILPERGLHEAAGKGDKAAAWILKHKLSEGQRDVLEGVIADLDLDVTQLPEDLKKNSVSDIKARAVGYSYCNIVCFNKVEYKKIYDDRTFTIPMSESKVRAYDVYAPTDMTKDFGEYAVVILDMQAFIRRVGNAAEQQGWKYLAHSVDYHPLTFHGKRVKPIGGMATLVSDPLDLRLFEEDGRAVIRNYDAFDKWDKHRIEQEYRIALERNGRFTDPVRLEIGALSDIAVPVKAKDVGSAIDTLLVQGRICPSVEEPLGNISREQMRSDFYAMGDGKVNFAVMIGGIAEVED